MSDSDSKNSNDLHKSHASVQIIKFQSDTSNGHQNIKNQARRKFSTASADIKGLAFSKSRRKVKAKDRVLRIKMETD